MAFENLCMYCFEDNGGADVCPHCGRDARAAVPQIQLLPGTLVYNQRFLIGRALGQDASGIVYAALDTKRNVKIRIREYLPRDCARRLNSGEIVPEPGAEEQFEQGMAKLRASVEGVEDPAKRHFFFEENGTGYIAQRKASAGSDMGGDDEPGERRGAKMAMVVAIAAILVLAVAIGVIALVSYFTNSTDKRTEAPMVTGADIWQAPSTPTPTPYAAATFGTLSEPTHSWMDFTNPDLSGNASDFSKPTPAPTPEGGLNSTINSNSDPELIEKLQVLLSDLGWLDKENINGKYDDATRQAVKDFQQYMNDTYALDPRLAVDGIAGKNTITWLLKTDIAMKPTPTPAPVTPSPTQAGQVVNENSSPEAVKYVQLQLVTLGIMDRSQVDGQYGPATRNAVKTFQMRVNDLLGYDALKEDGVCDDSTLAYLEYYVEWWNSNRPTTSPTHSNTAKPTQPPMPEAGGEVIDENSNKVSIQRVQEMLIKLGYLEGKADGVYGKKTFDAVKAFQQDIHDKVDPKVQITGKVDILTREYLEYYSERAGEPGTQAPEISVTGHEAHQNGVYVVGESGVKLAWKAEGAESYCVELINEAGRLVNKEDATPYTSMTMTQANLPGSETYKFVVTVLDKDGKRGESASVNLRSATKDTAPAVTAPTITVSGSLSYADGVYRIGSGGATISWTAEGAEAYSLYIYNAAGAEIYSSEYTDMTSYQLEAASMAAGEKYTFAVTAIPEDGSEGKSAAVNLMLTLQETATPAPTPATDFEAPVITVEGALGEIDGVYYVGEEKTTISWSAEGSVRAYSVYLTNSVGDVLVTNTQTDKTGMHVDPATMTLDEEYTVTVVAIPVNGEEAHGKSAQVRIALYNGQTPTPTEEPLAQIGQVAITVEGHSTESNGMFYVGKETISVAWHAEGDVKGYNVTISDANGNVLVDRELVTAKSVNIEPKDLDEDLIYTVDVTAVPAGGTAEDGNSAYVKLVRASAPKLGAVVLNVTGHVAEETGVYHVGVDPVTIKWSSENAVAYSIYLSDEDGKVLNKVENTTEASLNLGSDGMKEGEIYTLTVTAISPSGNKDDNRSASVELTMAEKPVELGNVSINVTGYADKNGDVYVLDEHGATVKWIAENAASYDVAILDADGNALKTYENVPQTEMQVDVSTMEQGMVYTLSITPIAETGDKGEPGSVMLTLAEPEPTPEPKPEIGKPVISVTGHDGVADGVYLIGTSDVTVEWTAEHAEVYNVYVYGEDGDEIISTENAKVLSMTVKPADMPVGEIVTVAVSGAADGMLGETAYVQLLLAEPEPTPTPEPVKLGVPQMSVEGYETVVDGVHMVADGTQVRINWSAENADTYDVAIMDETGDIIKAADGTTQTAMTIDPATMTAGVTYTVRVTPVAADGTTGEAGSVHIAKAEAEPTPEPVEIGDASISVNGHAEFIDNVYIVDKDDLHITWYAENAASYDAVLYDGNGDVLKAAEGTTATDFTLKAKDVPKGEVLTLTVVGIGANGEYGAEASVLIAAGEENKWPIRPESKPEHIQEVQIQLYNLGWILPEDKDFVEIGALDAITLQAVLDFQNYVIEQELNPEIALIDMMKPVIDEMTLTMLFDNMNLIYRPQ